MGDIDLIEELEDLKEKYETLRQDMDEMAEDKDRQISELEGNMEKFKASVELDCQEKLLAAAKESQEKYDIIVAELDMMREAFGGDAGGWEVKQTNSGSTYYQNMDTGEIRDTEPEVLYIAKAMQKVEAADAMEQELKTLKAKFKDLEMKKRETDLQSNKLKTELNAIRLVDRQWKDAAKTIYHGLTDVMSQFDAQSQQILNGLSEISKTSGRIKHNIPRVNMVDTAIQRYKKRIRDQESMINELNVKIRNLQIELDEQTDRVRRLSQGLEEEIERLCVPMRKKLADCMVTVMKEKAARAQERRELADLWPSNVMMPSVLMRYRPLTDEEREQRKKLSQETDASRALAIEIRANVIESKMWEMKYDDYGRKFYEHQKTGEAAWEEPPIMSYRPPPGRNELGNIENPEDSNTMFWSMLSDGKGQVYFKHAKTGEVRYVAPDAYRKVPPAKSTEVLVGEAATLVLSHIKSKITHHIARMKKLKERKLNPMPIAERKKLERAKAKARAALEIPGGGALGMPDDEEEEEQHENDEDLSLYRYDIETIEMLAAVVEDKTVRNPNPELDRKAKRSYLEDSEVRSFDVEMYSGPRLIETDMDEITLTHLRRILEELASKEETLEQRLAKTRENIKDFSFVLVEKLKVEDEKSKEANRLLALELAASRKLTAEAAEAAAAVEAVVESRPPSRKDTQPTSSSDAQQPEPVLEVKAADNATGDATGDATGQEVTAVPENAERPSESDGAEKKEDAGEGGDPIESVEKQQQQPNEPSSDAENAAKSSKEVVQVLSGSKPNSRPGSRPATASGKRPISSTKSGAASARNDDGLLNPELAEEMEDEVSILSELTFPYPSELTQKDAHEIGFLLGDPDLEDSVGRDQPENIVAITDNLADLAVFCGYVNLRIDDLPEDATMKFSLAPTDNEEAKPDDDWFTKSFFLSLAKERMDTVRQASSFLFDPELGKVDKTGVASEALLHKHKIQEEQGGAKAVPGDTLALSIKGNERRLKPFTSMGAINHENFEQVHHVWKARQLMAEVLIWQFQKEAVRRALEGQLLERTGASSGSRTTNRLTLVPAISRAYKTKPNPPIELRVCKVCTVDVSRRVWAEQQPTFVRFCLGGWTGRTQSEISTGKYMDWKDDTVAVLMPKENLHLDDLKIEVYEENVMLDDQLLCRSKFNISDVLGHNIGKVITFDIPMLDIRKRSAGLMKLSLKAEFVKDPLVEGVDPKGLNGEEELVSRDSTKDFGVTSGQRDERTFLYEGENVTGRTRENMRAAKEALDREDAEEAVLTARRESMSKAVTSPRKTPRTPRGAEESVGGEENEENVEEDQQVARVGDEIDRDIDLGAGSLGATSKEDNVDLLSGMYPSLADQQSTFGGLVTNLRGSGDGLVNMLVGNISLPQMWKLGYRVDKSVIKKLPNFAISRIFLRKRAASTKREVDRLLEQIESAYQEAEVIIKEKLEQSSSGYAEAKKRYMAQLEGADGARSQVQGIMERLDQVRNPLPLPKEPNNDSLGELVKVFVIPRIGQLDEKGKRKKNIPAKEMTRHIEAIQNGEMDNKDWNFGEYCPSAAQTAKLTTAANERNKVLEEIRALEEQARDRAFAQYKEELDRWDKDERVRKFEYEKIKKESRKANLKLDAYIERAERLSKEFNAIETDIQTMKELRDLHIKSKDRFFVMRAKAYLESERQANLIKDMKKRLLKSLDARKRAMDAPAGAVTAIEFESLCRASEENMRLLRLDIFNIRQGLVEEGVRMRSHSEELLVACNAEFARVKTLREVVNQRMCIDKILARNRYEVIHLYEDLDKLRIIEANADDRGLAFTADDLGERYLPTKPWESPGLVECMKLIDLVMAKITLAEGINISAGEIQKHLIQSMSTRLTAEMVPVRDSWLENSDYERAKGLVHDVTQWLALQKQRLHLREKSREQEVKELALQLTAAKEQIGIGLDVQDFETTAMVDSTASVVSVLQRMFHENRESSRATISMLEKAIGGLSKECQEIREELLDQKLVFEERTKILWAVIGTLQATVQQLSVKMEILMEEKDKTVLTSRLLADRLRYQLREERRHCANLVFIIHAQRGYMHNMDNRLKKAYADRDAVLGANREEIVDLRRQIWEHVFAFTRLSTDVDALFEFFANRLANLAGARKSINDALARNGASSILGAMVRSPRLMIRKWASRALGAMGWDGFIETRILLWDCVMYWKMFKAAILTKEKAAFDAEFDKFVEHGRYDAILNIQGKVEEFIPSGNVSLRTLVKQRRQWALRAVRRNEGPNQENLKLLNVENGTIPALLDLCLRFGDTDWEVSRNCSLAICIASYEVTNHLAMSNDQQCVDMLVELTGKTDIEVRLHAAVTIANLCHENERAQAIFGKTQAIEKLLALCGSEIVDLLEAATAALSNLTSYCDRNCQRVMEAGGVAKIMNIITRPHTENLLDLDQNDEIQANAAEILANISRFGFDKVSNYFDGQIVDALIYMATAKNLQVRRHTPLVLGNIAQSEDCRAEIGNRGGIEALFLVLEDEDVTVQANVLWALCNLMWYPPNQTHAGRFIGEILKFFYSEYLPVKIHAVILMGNVLYYNNPNRIRFLESEGAMELLMDFIRTSPETAIVEGSIRSLLSLSYVDFVASWLGKEAAAIPLLIRYITPPFLTRNAMLYALETICNLCVHHDNRSIILESGGIEALVALHADDDIHVQELSVHILEYLEDITPQEVLARRKQEIGLERMVILAKSEDKLVRAIAAESIGEEVWKNKQKQSKATEIGGESALLGIIENPSTEGHSLLSALWSLRNLVHGNSAGQAQFGLCDGIFICIAAVSRIVDGRYKEQTGQLLEAALACLVAAVLNEKTNSYRLLVVGLEAIIDLAESKVPLQDNGKPNEYVVRGMNVESVSALAKSLLLLLGPFNIVVCRNCHRKQELQGTTCLHCGHRLRVDVVDKDTLSFKKVQNKEKPRTAKELRRGPNLSKSSGSASAAATGTPDASFASPHRPSPQVMLSASTPNLAVNLAEEKSSAPRTKRSQRT